MRAVRSNQSLDRDEARGLLGSRKLVPRLWRRKGAFRLSPARLHHPTSLGYVSWLAFLIFWIVFGRLTLFYLMLTGGLISPISKGLPLEVVTTPRSAVDVEVLLAGSEVTGPDGLIEFDANSYVIYHVRIEHDRKLERDGRQLGLFSDRSICVDPLGKGRRPAVFVSIPANASYQEAVSEIDAIHSIGRRDGCYPHVYLTSLAK